MNTSPIQAANTGAVRRPYFLTCVALCAAVSTSTSFAQMQGMDHGSMPGMDHSSMPGMDASPPMAAPPAQPAPSQPAPVPAGRATPAAGSNTSPVVQPVPTASQYKRNPDGSYQIPGAKMAMADNDINYLVLFDQLEYVKSRNSQGWAWDAQGWVGRDYNRLWVKTEGERIGGKTDGRFEALYSRAVAAFWDAQVGVRHDFGASPSRQWLAFGVQGIAPYWFNVEAAGYLGPSGRTAARVKTEYSFRLTQVMFLTPEFEANAYGKSDRERGIGSGLSDVQLGLRLRYEIRREVAPYVGINWTRRIGKTADFARQAGDSASERQFVAGVRVWF